MILSKCAICHSKKSRFIKKQEASGILSNLRLNTPLIKTPLLFHIPHCFRIIKLMKQSINFYQLKIRRTASDKVLRDKAFHFANKPIHDGYQRSLVSLVYKYFDKKTSGTGANNEIKQK